MTTAYKTVALTGAAGNVGTPILRHLLDINKFAIIVLTRVGSSHDFPAEVVVKEVDYASPTSLTAALQGVDALINTIASPNAEDHIRLIRSALAAGVKHVVPAEYGMGRASKGASYGDLPVFGAKTASRNECERIVREEGGKMAWTTVANGPFLDWCLRAGFVGIPLDGSRKAHLFSGGENVHSWTVLEDVAKATTNVLLHPEETRNRQVNVSSIVMSQKRLLELAQQALDGGPEGWEVEDWDMKAKLDEGLGNLSRGVVNMEDFVNQIRYGISSPEYSRPWEKNDNELLGIKPMSEEQVIALIKEIAAEKK